MALRIQDVRNLARKKAIENGIEGNTDNKENKSDNSEEKMDLLIKVNKIKEENPDCTIIGPFIFYYKDKNHKPLDGKWMIFSTDIEYLSKLCSGAVNKGLIEEAKHSFISNNKGGACLSCFYINADDIEGNKALIRYFIENNAIDKTKAGKYRNISYKYDDQTRAREYGEDFKAKICLADYIDLVTGEFII